MLRRRWLVFPATVGFSALSAAAAVVLFAFASLLLSQNGTKTLAPAAGQVAQLPTQAVALTTVVESYSFAATASTGADTGAAPQTGDQNTADGRQASPAMLTATSGDLQSGGAGQANAKGSTAPTASPPLEDASAAAASIQQDALTAPDAAPLTEERQATLTIMNAQTDLAESPSGNAQASQGALSNSAAPAQPPAPTGAPGVAAAEPPSVMMAVPTATLPDTPTAAATDTPTEIPTFTPSATMTATHTPTATLPPTLVPPAPVPVGSDTIGVGLLLASAVLLVIAAGTAWTIWRRR
jgi:hypothetical protein